MQRLGYVPALDGVRGIAILLVVGFHYIHFPLGGQDGVDLFFVLSGFLITSLLLEERQRSGNVSLSGFYARRAKRLLPALFVMLAVFVAVGAVQGQNELGVALIGTSYVGNALVAYGSNYGHELARSPLGPLWSLAEEEQFYLLWPALLLVLVRFRHPARWIAGLFVVLVLYRAALFGFHSSPRVYAGPDTRADGLIAGCVLAFLWRRGFRVGEGVAKLAVVILGVAAFCAWDFPWWPSVGLPIFEIGCAALVCAAVSETELARGLSWSPLTWLGERSYSLYLWHLPVIVAATALVGDTIGAKVGALFAATAIAALSYRFVERRFRYRARRPSTPILEAGAESAPATGVA
jgi:peptidoglycan/LPS O-acetylase OafA/YrhL